MPTRRHRSNRRPAGPRALGILAAALLIAGARTVSARCGAPEPSGAGPGRPHRGDPAANPAPPALPRRGRRRPRWRGRHGRIARQIDHNIGLWTANLTANPTRLPERHDLATLYHGRGRLTADLGDQQRALQAARTAIAIAPTYTPARDLRRRSSSRSTTSPGPSTPHQAVLATDPSDLGALATRFDAEIELGRIDDASADLSVLSAATSGAPIDVRAARLPSVTGDPAGALVPRERGRGRGDGRRRATPTDRGFYAYAVGEYARVAGDATAARAAYREALDLRATDLASMVGLARIDAFEGDLDAAIDGLQRAAAIAPQPETLGLLADLLTQRGAPGDAAAAPPRPRPSGSSSSSGEIQAQVFDRQLLRFELDHGGATAALVDRARASLDARPDWTGHDTLAWALYRTGRLDDAATEIAAARALGADDARLRYHEGAIDLARGTRRAAGDGPLGTGPGAGARPGRARRGHAPGRQIGPDQALRSQATSGSHPSMTSPSPCSRASSSTSRNRTTCSAAAVADVRQAVRSLARSHASPSKPLRQLPLEPLVERPDPPIGGEPEGQHRVHRSRGVEQGGRLEPAIGVPP